MRGLRGGATPWPRSRSPELVLLWDYRAISLSRFFEAQNAYVKDTETEDAGTPMKRRAAGLRSRVDSPARQAGRIGMQPSM